MISLTRVKLQLGIGNTTYDTAITRNIPICEALYREISGNRFVTWIAESYSSGNDTILLDNKKDSIIHLLKYGDLLTGTGFPDETYITAIDEINGEITLSEDLTADGVEFVKSTNISYWPVISAMIWYKISQASTTAQDTPVINSKSVGPLSVSYAADEINQRYGLPQKIVAAIPKYAGAW